MFLFNRFFYYVWIILVDFCNFILVFFLAYEFQQDPHPLTVSSVPRKPLNNFHMKIEYLRGNLEFQTLSLGKWELLAGIIHWRADCKENFPSQASFQTWQSDPWTKKGGISWRHSALKLVTKEFIKRKIPTMPINSILTAKHLIRRRKGSRTWSDETTIINPIFHPKRGIPISNDEANMILGLFLDTENAIPSMKWPLPRHEKPHKS